MTQTPPREIGLLAMAYGTATDPSEVMEYYEQAAQQLGLAFARTADHASV